MRRSRWRWPDSRPPGQGRESIFQSSRLERRRCRQGGLGTSSGRTVVWVACGEAEGELRGPSFPSLRGRKHLDGLALALGRGELQWVREAEGKGALELGRAMCFGALVATEALSLKSDEVQTKLLWSQKESARVVPSDSSCRRRVCYRKPETQDP